MSEERANDCTLDALVLRLYQARQERSRAKEARADARRAAGDCCHDCPCWLRNDGDMCTACAKAIPATKEYWRKADAAGAALRAVLRVGRGLSQNEEVSLSRRLKWK